MKMKKQRKDKYSKCAKLSHLIFYIAIFRVAVIFYSA